MGKTGLEKIGLNHSPLPLLIAHLECILDKILLNSKI